MRLTSGAILLYTAMFLLYTLVYDTNVGEDGKIESRVKGRGEHHSQSPRRDRS